MPMQKLHLGTLDYSILLTYFVCVLALGLGAQAADEG